MLSFEKPTNFTFKQSSFGPLRNLLFLLPVGIYLIAFQNCTGFIQIKPLSPPASSSQASPLSQPPTNTLPSEELPAQNSLVKCALEAPSKFSAPSGNGGFGFTGYADSLEIYDVAPNSGKKIVVRENYGYSVYSAVNPLFPVLEEAHNFNSIPTYGCSGDCYETTTTVGASADGQRILLGYKEGHGVIVNSPSPGLLGNYSISGEFQMAHSMGVSVVKTGSNYIGIEVGSTVFASDVTSPLADNPSVLIPGALSGHGLARANSLSGGGKDQYLVYAASSQGIGFIDASSALPNSLESSVVFHVIPISEFGFYDYSTLPDGTSIGIHPLTKRIYVAAAATSPSGFKGIGGVVSTDAKTFKSIGNGSRIDLGAAFSLFPEGLTFIATKDDLLLVAFSKAPYTDLGGPRIHKISVFSINQWVRDGVPKDLSPLAKFDGASISGFRAAAGVRGFEKDNRLYLYSASGDGAHVFPMKCDTQSN